MLDMDYVLAIRRHWKVIATLIAVTIIPTPVLLAGVLYLGKRKYEQWKDGTL